MENTQKSQILKEFRTIPGVGKSIAEDLWSLGLRSFADLKEQNPEALYEQLCVQQRTKVDRCMLYVFRCAIYFVSHEAHEAHLLLWWNWKDEQLMKPTAQA
jgi:Pathogenicity locus